MRAKVTSAFKGMDNQSTEPVDIKVGAILEDNPAWYAVQSGNAEWEPGGQPNEAETDAMRSAPQPAHPIEQKKGTGPANTGPETGTTSTDRAAADRQSNRTGQR